MSDSGSTQIPAATRQSNASVPSRFSEARTGDLVGVPNDLRDVSNPTRVRGQVVERSDQGSITVRTQRGDVTVQLPPDQPPPREGQRVEVEIQPGRPPREATIRTEQSRSAPSEKPQPPDVQERHRSSTTPVKVEVNQSSNNANVTITQTSDGQPSTITNTEAATPSAPPQVEAGVTARLQPISAQEAASIITASAPETLSANLSARSVDTAQIIATQAQLQTIATPVTTAPISAEVVTSAPAATVPATNIAAEVIAQVTQSAPSQAVNLSAPQTSAVNIDIVTPAPASAPSVVETALSFFTSETNPAPTQSALQNIPASSLSFEAAGANALPSAQTINLNPAAPALPTQSALAEAAESTDTSFKARIESVGKAAAEIVDPKAEAQNTPRASAPTITEAVRAGSLPAVVSGKTAQSLPVLSIFSPQSGELQNFTLHIPSPDLPAGTQLQLTPQGALPAAPVIAAPPTISTMLTPGAWPLLQDLQVALTQINPAAAQVMSNITSSPATPAQFTPAALFFLAAVRSGDIGSWLGDKTMDILRREGRGNLLSRIGQESSILSRMASEPVSQEWRALPLPMFMDNDMQRMALFYRNEDQAGDDGASNNKQTRFVFDLNLSQMGPVQVDGLFRNARLDVILRTEQHFTEAMKMDMRRSYTEALSKTDVGGELSFQNQSDQWVKINVADERENEVVV